MNDNGLDLASVHWENGMTLTDEHFVRQERYFDSSILWLLRYTTATFGLVGSGPRLGEGQLRPDVYDPEVSVLGDSAGCQIAVSACRGITLGGSIVDLAGESVELQLDPGQVENGDTLYVVAPLHEKNAFFVDSVDYDGQRQAERRQKYELTLHPSQEQIPYCLAIARLVKSAGAINRDPNYIPPCAFLSGHSGLIVYAERITGRLKALAARFTELHRAMKETLPIAQRAGIMAELGLDEITFAGRMVVALQECLYEASESVQAPHRFLGQFRRLLHLAYAFVSLSPRVRDHFQEVLEKLQKDYLQPLNDHVDRLLATRQQRLNADLALELQLIDEALQELEHVEEGMEAKYIDFRVNKSVASVDHFFDGDLVYRRIKVQQAAQSNAGDVSTSFRGLNLSGERVNYRIVLAGDPEVSIYSEVPIEISINDVGYRGAGQRVSSVPRKGGQFNFDFDFKAPQGQTISDLTVRYPAQFTFRTVMLFEEIRLGVARTEESPRPINRPEPQPLPNTTQSAQPVQSARSRVPGERKSAFDVGPRRAPLPAGDRQPNDRPPGPPRRRFD